MNEHWLKYSTLVIFLLALLLLYLQGPYEFQAVDTSFHAAKIHRASEGDPFLDPFTGDKSLYPSLFHALFGLINSCLGLSPVALIHLIGLITWIGFFASFALFLYFLTGQLSVVCLGSLLVSLITYVPQTRYFLLQGPATFSSPFVLLALACFCQQPSRVLYFLGGFLLSLAFNIWWYNSLVAIAWMIAFLYQKGLKYSLWIGLGLFIPCLFSLWHLYQLRDILPLYMQTQITGGNLQPQVSGIWEHLKTWFLTSFHNGIFFYPEYFNKNHEGWNLLNTLYSYGITIPFTVLLMFVSIPLTIRSKDLVRVTFLSAWGIWFLALLSLKIGNMAILYRVQFYSHLLLLGGVLSHFNPKSLAMLGWVATLWLVLHRPDQILKSPPIDHETQELISFLKEYQESRLFFQEDSLRQIAPYISIKSFVGYKSGVYFYQPRALSEAWLADYLTLVNRAPQWKEVVDRRQVNAFVLRKDRDSQLISNYTDHLSPCFENAKWIVMGAIP